MHRILPIRLVSTVFWISSNGSSSRIVLEVETPALLIQMSILPKRSNPLFHKFCTDSLSWTRQGCPIISPSPSSCFNAFSTDCSLVPETTTWCPRCKNSRARPRPIPRVLPVITTVFISDPLFFYYSSSFYYLGIFLKVKLAIKTKTGIAMMAPV